MIGYISGKFLTADDNSVIIDTGGVGYSVLVPTRTAQGLLAGAAVALYVHTNLRENALELFGFQSAWEKRVFQALIGVSNVGPRTALAIMGAIEPEALLSAVLREDRATLTKVSGVGKKTADMLILELAEKSRKLLAERPGRAEPPGAAGPEAAAPGRRGKSAATTPAQGSSASPLDVTDLWNEAVIALANLGYTEGSAIAAIRAASEKGGQAVSLEKLIMSSLQLLSRGLQ